MYPTNFPREIVALFLSKSHTTSSAKIVCKQFNGVVKTLFEKANEEMTKIFPLLEKNFLERKETTPSYKLFMQFMNCLHDQAYDLGIDIQSRPQNEDRLNWEYEHYKILVSEVAIKYKETQVVRAKDFKAFVQTVANAIGASATLKEISEAADAKKDVFLDPIVESEDSHNHREWDKLLKNKKIASLNHLGFGANLMQHQFTYLPSEIGQLPQVTNLILQGHKIKVLPKSFENLINLTQLDLGDHQWKYFNIDRTKHTKLECLTFREGKITSTMNFYGNVTYLTKMHFSD